MSEVELWMTGANDRYGCWQLAVGGYPGAGKTMFASTAPNPYMLFFADNPRLKSIADRNIMHSKLVNKVGDNDELESSVMDQLLSVYQNLKSGSMNVDTLVIDTADEMLQELKAARRLQKGGEFSIADWGWLGDTFREVITSFVDLHMNVIVLFHLRRVEEDGMASYEPALQGSVKDEFAGWFDIVGVIEAKPGEEEDVTERTLLTQPSSRYPWVKDHSGRLPSRFRFSNDFVGDYERLVGLASKEPGWSERQVIGTIQPSESFGSEEKLPVPTPEELDTQKSGIVVAESATVVDVLLESQTLVESVLGSVDDITEACQGCGIHVEPKSLVELTNDRFGKTLCRDCYKKEK